MGEDRAREDSSTEDEQETPPNHSALFKAKVAMDALRDGQTIAEVAQRHDVHPNQVAEWRRQLHERAAEVFGGAATPAAPSVDLKELHAKIG